VPIISISKPNQGEDMFLNSEGYTASSQSFFESRLAAFGALTSVALQGVEKIVALNMAVAKASADAATATAMDFMSARGPHAALSLATACAKPNAEKVAAYGRDLSEIVSATQAEFTMVADAHVAKAQSKVSAWVDGIVQNAPAGTEPAAEMLKSVVATAQAGYEQFSSTAKQAVEATETHVAKASNQLTQGATKSATK
jgi:phasin family protein